jgi:hypothetical protein
MLALMEFVLFAPRRRRTESITAVTPVFGETLNCRYTESICVVLFAGHVFPVPAMRTRILELVPVYWFNSMLLRRRSNPVKWPVADDIKPVPPVEGFVSGHATDAAFCEKAPVEEKRKARSAVDSVRRETSSLARVVKGEACNEVFIVVRVQKRESWERNQGYLSCGEMPERPAQRVGSRNLVDTPIVRCAGLQSARKEVVLCLSGLERRIARGAKMNEVSIGITRSNPAK